MKEKVFSILCQALDEKNWKYKLAQEKLMVRLGVNGDEIAMEISARIDGEREQIYMISFLPFKIPEDKRIDTAIAILEANRQMAMGSFDLDLTDGTVSYRIVSTYKGSLLSTEAVKLMIDALCSLVDEYNDQLLALSKGMITLNDFIKNN